MSTTEAPTVTLPCRCGHCDQEVDENSKTGWAEPCKRRWWRAGKPASGPPPPDPSRPHGRARPKVAPVAAGPADCACGECGETAVRPAREPRLSERCYRRRLRLGLPEGAIPPPPVPPGAPRPRVRHPRPPKQQPDPTPEAFGITDFRAAEVLRRIPGETGRAQAYAICISKRDYLGADAVCCKVKDLDAFGALLDAGLDVTKARAALAEQLTREFPDIQEAETEVAA